MKAYQVVEQAKPLQENEFETPQPSGKEVLLKTVACGVCHSDVHIHEGFFDLGGGQQLPMPLLEPLTMGHEIFGEVVDLWFTDLMMVLQELLILEKKLL